MNCICNDEDECMYCLDEKKECSTWNNLQPKHKSKLLAYAKLILKDGINLENETHFNIANFVMTNNLEVSCIPNNLL